MNKLRSKKLGIFLQIADVLERERDFVLSCLRRIETNDSAIDELNKSLKALRSYDVELSFLENRKSFGEVSISLPFNNPLYSFILYSFGPCLGGSVVHVRPSKITSGVLLKIINTIKDELQELEINITTTSGLLFINKAQNDPNIQTLLFTGSWKNVSQLKKKFPKEKRLIYCGSGINPFIVSQGALKYHSMKSIVNLAISSRIYNSGQDCLCSERFYVHSSVAYDFITILSQQIREIKVSNSIDDCYAEVMPLLGGGADIVSDLFKQHVGKGDIWHVPFNRDGDCVYPSLIEVSLGHFLLKKEKYAPIFVIAQYETAAELDKELRSDYLFGATVCGNYRSKALEAYPHLTFTKTVISSEAEDSHVPFGGKYKSGFVYSSESYKDGPILFSVETTKEIAF